MAKKKDSKKKGELEQIQPWGMQFFKTGMYRNYGVGMDADTVESYFNLILGLSIQDLYDILSSDDAPAIIRVLASAVLMDAQKGDLANTEKILDRVYGKAIQRQITKSTIDYTELKKQHFDVALSVLENNENYIKNGLLVDKMERKK